MYEWGFIAFGSALVHLLRLPGWISSTVVSPMPLTVPRKKKIVVLSHLKSGICFPSNYSLYVYYSKHAGVGF